MRPRHTTLAILALGLLYVFASGPANADIRFGVMANRGELQAQNQWIAFTEYLARAVGQPVSLVTWPIDKTYEIAESGQVDFILTNPAQSAGLVAVHGATTIASLERGDGARFGGVIIASRFGGVAKAADVRGKTVMAYNPGSAGAYLFQRYHLQQQGIDVTKDAAKLLYAKTQDDIVLATRAGMADVGFVRTGVLESMVEAGRLSLDDIVIVDAVGDGQSSLVRSTALYPSWFIVALKETPAEMSRAVADAAFALPADDPAATSAKVVGFTAPLPIDGMISLMRGLKIAPLDTE